jgi:hypothetical protein
VRSRGLLAAAALLALAACAQGDQRVVGTVVAIEGDLTTVAAFEIQTRAGDRMTLVPAPELTTFTHGDHGGAPITHLWDHLRDGAPIRVTFREQGGVFVAVAVEDAP